MRNIYMPPRQMDSTRVCQLHFATRFMSLSHFWSINFSTIVRETVASFSFAFRRIFLPHPGGHTLQKVLRSQLFPVQFSALIFFFSVSCVTLPLLFAIFHFLLHTFHSVRVSPYTVCVCCFVRSIWNAIPSEIFPLKSIKIRDDGTTMDDEYFSSTICVFCMGFYFA